MSGAETGVGVMEPVVADLGVVRSGIEEVGVNALRL
jgi:hypothetical protein